MTRLVVPPADADGYWHYTYITYHPDTGEWYGGKHSTTNLNDGYLGSGNWVLNHPAQEELSIEIVEFFYSEEHAYAAEMLLVDLAVIAADKLCRNEREGGTGLSSKEASRIAVRRHADPRWRNQISAAMKRHYEDQEWVSKWRLKVSEKNALMAKTPEWRRKMLEVGARNAVNPEWLRKNKEVGARNAADPKWRQKMKEGVANRKANAEWLQNVRNAVVRRDEDPEWRQKMKDVGARNSADPEWRRKISEGKMRANLQRLMADKLAAG